MEFNFQKIIILKIFVVDKKTTRKKVLEYHFLLKKIKKGGYKIEGLGLEKFRCVLKFQKIITWSIFVVDKKVT